MFRSTTAVPSLQDPVVFFGVTAKNSISVVVLSALVILTTVNVLKKKTDERNAVEPSILAFKLNCLQMGDLDHTKKG